MTLTFEERQAAWLEARRRNTAAERFYLELVDVPLAEARAILAELLRVQPASHSLVVVGNCLALVGLDVGEFDGVRLGALSPGAAGWLAEAVAAQIHTVRVVEAGDASLLALLAAAEGPVTASDATSEGSSKKTTYRVLTRLVRDGLVRSHHQGAGHPCHYEITDEGRRVA